MMSCSTIHSNNRPTTPIRWLKLRGRFRGRLKKKASSTAVLISPRGSHSGLGEIPIE